MNPGRRLVQILTLKCEGASSLESRALDERLGLADRVALYGHLLACGPCRRLGQQLRVIRRAVRRGPNADAARAPAAGPGEGLSADARARLAGAIRQAMGGNGDDPGP